MKVQGILLSKNVAEIVDTKVDRPKGNEVLIKTKACGICMGDVYVFRGKVPGGRVMGHEGVGIVAEIGEEVKNVRVGDKVTTLGGAFAEYYKTDCRSVEKIPEDVEELAYWISEPAACAVNGIRGSEIQIGDNVCLIGCGYMGLLLIQVMPKTNINNLIALDIQSQRLELAREFGAEHAINPREVDAVKEVRGVLGGGADVVIEASGAPGTLNLATELVRGGWENETGKLVQGGKIVIFGRHVVDEKVSTEKWHMKGTKILNTAPASSSDFNKDFHAAVNLLRKGVFNQKPLITHRFLYRDAAKAFKTASERPVDYIKGVIAF